MDLANAVSSLQPWAVLVAALSGFLLGGLWYSPLMFARAWMALSGLSEERLRRDSPVRIFGPSFLLALVSALVLALFLGPTATATFGLVAGALVGAGWVATSMGVTYLFERKPLRLFLIDAGYHLVHFAVMGAILGAWTSGGATDRPALAVSAGRVLVTETTLEAPVDEVWRLFTTREGVESWMVPQAEVDLRVGGSLRTHYDPQGRLGDAKTITNTILSYEPRRMLSMRATGFPKDFPFRKATEGTWSVLYFEELPGQRTQLRLVGLGYGDDPESREAYAFFEKGNAWTLEQLRKKLQGNEPTSEGTGAGDP